MLTAPEWIVEFPWTYEHVTNLYREAKKEILVTSKLRCFVKLISFPKYIISLVFISLRMVLVKMFGATSEVQLKISNYRSPAWTTKTWKTSAVSYNKRSNSPSPSPCQQEKKLIRLKGLLSCSYLT